MQPTHTREGVASRVGKTRAKHRQASETDMPRGNRERSRPTTSDGIVSCECVCVCYFSCEAIRDVCRVRPCRVRRRRGATCAAKSGLTDTAVHVIHAHFEPSSQECHAIV
jgi:hypothetical protein